MATTGETVEPLRTQACAHAALAAAVETGLAADRSRARSEVERALVGVVDALGLTAETLEEALAPPFGEALRAELRSDVLQGAALVRGAHRAELPGGWTDADADVVEAQGETGRVLRFAAPMLIPGLEGLEERLRSPGARFLDVGAGTAVLSIELCGLYPEVAAVGLEPLAAARDIAAGKIASADLADRIEMRDQLVEDLDDRDAFDFAYVPTMFLGRALTEGLTRVRRALRPGGWILVLTLGETGDELAAAVRRLRVALWGGSVLGAGEGEELLAELGLEGITVPPAVGAYQPVLGRLPPHRGERAVGAM